MNPRTRRSLRLPKVLLVTGSYPPQLCGVGDFTAGLAKALASKRWAVTVAASASWKTPATVEKGVRVRREMPDWNILRLGRFLRMLKEEAPDLVHLQYPSRGYGWHLLPNILPLVLKLLRPRLGVVTTLHEFEGLNPLRQLSFLGFALFSRMIVASCAEVRRGLEAFYPWTRGRVTVIPIGSFLSPGTARAPRVKGTPLLVFPGFLLHRKGPLEALQAVAELRRDYPDVRLVFASEFREGIPFHRELKKTVQRLGLEGNVSFLGNMDHRALSSLLRKADLVVLPFHDGASTRRSTLISAIRLECATVTTEVEGMLGEFRRGGVILCKPQDPASLASAIRGYLGNRKTRNLLRGRLKHLASLFDWRRIAATHAVLYEGVIGRGS